MLEALHILISIIFREADPGLTYAIEPITLALMAGGALSKLGGELGKSGQIYDALVNQSNLMAGRGEEALGEAEGVVSDAEARRADYDIAPSFSELRSRVLEDPVSDFLRRKVAASEAGQMDVLKAAGARAVTAGTQRTAQETLNQLAKIADDENKRVAQGLGVVGAAEQRVEDQRLVDARSDLEYGRGLEAEALSQIYGAEDMLNQAELQRRLGNTEAISGGLEAAFDIAGQTDWGQGLSQGGKITAYKDGGELMRNEETPGEFSHKNNPIDIMQDGAKIGEMTGGEGIVSPQDMGDWEQEAAKGNSPLHRKIRAWFRKINQKDNG